MYILMGVAAQFLGTAGIRVFQKLLDHIAQATGLRDGLTLLLLYGAMLIGATLLHYLLEYPHTVLSTGIAEQLKVMALGKVSGMDYAAYQNTGTGDLIKLIDNGAQAGKNILHSFYLRILHDSLYRHLSYISQDAPVFDTSIRENILFDEERPDTEIYRILEQVQLKEKVLNLPEGLKTKIGERGMKLSGGERQRLAFGRVMAQQRNLVILDEPVSALDNKTEKSLMDTMLSTFAGKTLVIVAHRLHSIRHVDTIILVRNGEIAGIGSFDSLMASSPYFRELWSLEEPIQLSDVR